MVLIDSAHERQLEANPTMRAAVESGVAQFKGLAPLASWGLLAMLPENIPGRGLPDAAHRDYVAVLATTNYFAVAADETAMLLTNLERMAAMPRSIEDWPLTVLSRGRVDGPPDATRAELVALEPAWQGLQVDLTGLSRDSQHVVAEDSGHYVQLDQPDLVVEEVRKMLAKL
jgi:pimeloyl-ACP methyl ester carboxylesterase